MERPGHTRTVEVDEVIPPRRTQSQSDDPAEAILRLFAHLLDELFRVPGTKLRFGLDPLLGLLPGFGDTLAGLISTALLSFSVRQGIPKIVVVRMALNILLNTVLGAVPLFGDAFSFWFKSNVRNYDLYRQHAQGLRPSTKADWLFVCALVGGVALILILVFFGALYLVAKLSERLPGAL